MCEEWLIWMIIILIFFECQSFYQVLITFSVTIIHRYISAYSQIMYIFMHVEIVFLRQGNLGYIYMFLQFLWHSHPPSCLSPVFFVPINPLYCWFPCRPSSSYITFIDLHLKIMILHSHHIPSIVLPILSIHTLHPMLTYTLT